MIIKTFGIIFTVVGTIFLIKPASIRDLVQFYRDNDYWITTGAALNIIIALLFFKAAPESHIPSMVIIFGTLCLIKGIFIFATGKNKIKDMLSWWEHRPSESLRLISIITILMGALLIFSA